MRRGKYILRHEFGDNSITFEFDDEITWADMLEKFQDFLAGCGFVLPGPLDCIEDDDAN